MNIREIQTMGPNNKALRIAHIGKHDLIKIEIWDELEQPPQTLTISFDSFALLLETMATLGVLKK